MPIGWSVRVLVPLTALAGTVVIGAVVSCGSNGTPESPLCQSNSDCATNTTGHVCASVATIMRACVECGSDADCGTTKKCDLSYNRCVGCLADKDCSGATPKCDVNMHDCVGCVGDDDCGAGKLCHAQQCVNGCSGAHPQCPMGQVCNVTSGACVACLADGDCKDAATPRCDVKANQCVACLPANDNCPKDEYCSGTTCMKCALGLSFMGLDYTQQYGNTSGGQAHEDACPMGQVVIGYTGLLHPSGYHGQLQAQCGIPSVSGCGPTVTIAKGDLTPLEGAQGVAPPWSLACPADQVVVGFSGRSGALLDFLSIDCAPLTVTGTPGNYKVMIGAITSVPGVGDMGGTAFSDTPCPPGEVATENHLRAGDGIDAFGIGCATPAVKMN